tara:strand:- start:424 stop:597 length:174 start_codon:yes stop_codon:yes gene_type:complete
VLFAFGLYLLWCNNEYNKSKGHLIIQNNLPPKEIMSYTHDSLTKENRENESSVKKTT